MQQRIRRSIHRVVALICAVAVGLGGAIPVMAEAPVSFRIFSQPLRWTAGETSAIAEASAAAVLEQPTPKRIIIDTDPGVDDAAALGWALIQDRYPVDILGIVVTAGNAGIDDATRNALVIRHLAERPDVPVYVGERKPLVQQLSETGKLIHGIDGLWSAGSTIPQNLSQAQRQAWRFYCEIGRTQPGATIVALGPLTNVARAIRSCRSDMQNYAEIIVLGGAKFGGNTTPVAEFNIWQDPEAAELVFGLGGGVELTLVTIDTFTQLQFTLDDVAQLAFAGGPLAKFLGCATGVCPPGFPFPPLDNEDPNPINFGVIGLSPLGLYLNVQLGAVDEASIPDIAAIMFALDPSLGSTAWALGKVLLRPELARGQTILGLGLTERITMIADDRELSRLVQAAYADPLVINGVVLPNDAIVLAGLGAFLAREPDNVKVVRWLNTTAMKDMFMQDLLAQETEVAGVETSEPATFNPLIPQLFIPLTDRQ